MNSARNGFIEENDRPLDLSALNPDRDPLAESRLVEQVMARVAAERMVEPDMLSGVWSLVQPIAIAASVVIAVLALSRTPKVASAPETVAEAVGVPPMFLAVTAQSSLPRR